MTYDEAVAYLNSFTNYEQVRQPTAMSEISLERMARLCHRLGDPQWRFRSILVAGTNGKGSVCTMLYSMLRESPAKACPERAVTSRLLCPKPFWRTNRKLWS